MVTREYNLGVLVASIKFTTGRYDVKIVYPDFLEAISIHLANNV